MTKFWFVTGVSVFLSPANFLGVIQPFCWNINPRGGGKQQSLAASPSLTAIAAPLALALVLRERTLREKLTCSRSYIEYPREI